MNANTSAKRDVKSGVTRWLIREIIGALFVAAILFVSSGDLDWAMAWVLIGVYLVWTGATAWTVIPTNPEMLVERTRPKKDTKDAGSLGAVVVTAIQGFLQNPALSSQLLLRKSLGICVRGWF